MSIVLDGTTGLAGAATGALNGTLGATTPSTVAATTITASGTVTLGSAALASPSGSAPLYLCRAWVNIAGVDVPSIRASGNVSSITDTGVGDYTINFTTAMTDSNYAVVSSLEPYIYTGYGVIGGSGFAGGFTRSTTAYEIKTGYVSTTGGGATSYDMSTVQVAIFR
jgi:hypothetical protein